MADLADTATVIASALTEIGINGRLDVTMDGCSSPTLSIGEPTGDDYEVVVAVMPLVRDADTTADLQAA